jgi:hypothetical protein
MSDPKRSGPDRTIILRIPRIDPLSLEIDLAAVRAGQTPPQFCKTVLASVLACAVPAPAPQPAARRAREARAA